ncbi:MAG: hypothetical protein EX263_11310 [Flavobacteriaceae bacterium]|nr:MAG: hypothetical protein EX263_11310 [Flavobacteriaceae bacterium]
MDDKNKLVGHFKILGTWVRITKMTEEEIKDLREMDKHVKHLDKYEMLLAFYDHIFESGIVFQGGEPAKRKVVEWFIQDYSDEQRGFIIE